jgi:hypothetical protein
MSKPFHIMGQNYEINGLAGYLNVKAFMVSINRKTTKSIRDFCSLKDKPLILLFYL